MRLAQSDFNNIGVVAKHCDLTKLEVAENEAHKFDMAQLYCDFWYDIIEIWNELNAYEIALAECELDLECETPPITPIDYALKIALIYGGEYMNCANKTRTQDGIKTVLAYYAYARYILLNGYNDTATGVVAKTNEFSIPTPLKELQALSDMKRNMGKATFESTLGFLCANKSTFIGFNAKDCGCKCSCNEIGCGSPKTTGSMRSSNITKRI